jgi:hypothetical protein
MSVDDRLGRASRSLRAEAASGAGELSLDAYRRRKGRRVAMATGSAVVLLVLGVTMSVLLSTPADEERSAEDPPVVPTVPTTLGVATPTTEPSLGEPIPISGVMPGWEDLDDAPVAGRFDTARLWTGTHLLMWGGHDFDATRPFQPSAYHQDGYLYEPASGSWQRIVPPEGMLCRWGTTDAVWTDGWIVLVARSHDAVVRDPDCLTSVAFEPASGAWIPLTGEFFDRLGAAPVVWTGEWLVAPTIALAFDPDTGDTFEIPGGVTPAAAPVDGVRAFWTGDRIVMAGLGVRAWEPGDEEWASYDPAPVGIFGRANVWSGDRLWVVTFEMEVASLDLDTGEWQRHENMPLRFYACGPEPLDAGGHPVVRTCAGIAVWQEGETPGWIPAPNPYVGVGSADDLVATGDAMYSIGPRVLRFDIERRSDGSVALPPTIPIGTMNLDVPDGWAFVRSFGWDPDVADGERHGVVFERGGVECTVASMQSTAEDGFNEIGSITIDRPGRAHLEGRAYWREDDLLVFAFADPNGIDIVEVECRSGFDAVLSVSATEFARGLWSPSDPVPEVETHWWSLYLDSEGLGFQVPLGGSTGWYFEEGPTGYVQASRAIVTMATVPLRFDPNTDCATARIPESVLEAMGPGDALVSVGSTALVPIDVLEPAVFTLEWLDQNDSGGLECVDGHDGLSLWSVVYTTSGGPHDVIVAVGSEADETTRAQVLGILNRLEFDSITWQTICCLPPGPGTRVQIPSEGWHVSDASLSSSSNPELFALGTFDMRPGGDTCPHFPEFAYEDMGPTDAFVVVQEGPPDAQGVPPRPVAFDESMGGPLDIPFCLSRPDADQLFIRYIPFVDGDRVIYVFIGIGPEASDQRRAEVFGILDRMHFSPAE